MITSYNVDSRRNCSRVCGKNVSKSNICQEFLLLYNDIKPKTFQHWVQYSYTNSLMRKRQKLESLRQRLLFMWQSNGTERLHLSVY